MFFHLLLTELADRDLISNIKVVAASARIKLLNQIRHKVVSFMEFKILICCSLNKEAISLQKPAHGYLDFHLFLLWTLCNLLQRFIKQSPHPLLIRSCPFRLIQIGVKLVDIVSVKKVVCIYLSVKVTNIRRRDCFKENGILVIRLKGSLDVIVAVFEIQYEGGLIIRWANSVQAR